MGVPRLRAAVGSAAVIVLVSVLAPTSPAHAAGSALLTETFTNAVVLDPLAVGLNNACLTAATTPPPTEASNLGPCAFTAGAPATGVTPGWLQLTDTTPSQGRGGMIYNRAIPSAGGLIVEFDQAQYGGNVGADGIGFFLSDGSRQLTTTGASGGGLGYAQRGGAPGVAGGYIGVGLDVFGNFANDQAGTGSGCATPSPYGRVANSVTLRGPGDGLTGYCHLVTTAAAAPTGPSTLPGALRVAAPASADAAARNVRITVSPDAFPTVTVEIDFTGTRGAYQQVLQYTMTDAAPSSYKFGFSASTGSFTDVHLVRNVGITSVDPLGAINIVKQVDRTDPQPDAYALGDVVPYQFVVTNTGADALSDVVVTDPKIADIVCPDTVLGPAGSPSGSFVCTGSYTITGEDATQDTFVNTATVTATDTLGDTVEGSASSTVPVILAEPALSIEKDAVLDDIDGDGLADEGEEITYSFVVTNTGNVTVTDPTVSDPLLGDVVVCPAGAVAPGADVTCTAPPYVVTEADVIAGEVSNTATATATPPPGVPDIDPPTDSVDVPTVEAVAALSIEKDAVLDDVDGDGLASAGEEITYSFVVSNTGNVTVTDPEVSDPLLGDVVVCPAGALAPGEDVTCTAPAYVVTEADVVAGEVSNTATATATPPPGVPDIDPPTDSVDVPTIEAVAALSIDKDAVLDDVDGDGLASVGEEITYSFVVTNTGNVTVTDPAVSDPLLGDVVTCPAGALAPGESVTCTAPVYTVTDADVVAGAVSNTASATATPPPGGPDIDPPTDSVDVPTVEAVASLAIEKTAVLDDADGDGLASVGEEITYTFVVTNTGTVTLTDPAVSDPLLGDVVTCPADSLAPGDSTTCTAPVYTVTDADVVAGAVSNTATATATPPSGVADIDPPTDSTTVPTVGAVAALTLEKRASLDDANGDGVANAGEEITFSFVVANTGTVSVTAPTVSDPLLGDEVICPTDVLAPGDEVVCTSSPYVVTAADVVAGAVLNSATATATPPPGVADIDPPTDSVTVDTAAAPAVTPPGGELGETGGSAWGLASGSLTALIAIAVGTLLLATRRRMLRG